RLLSLVDALGRPPLTLLAVPNYHQTGGFDAHREPTRILQLRRDRGDEIALHGYYHRDDASAPRTPQAWLRRRLLTAREGEFSAISTEEAAHRIHRGWSELNIHFGPVCGFVAPAWLTSDDAWPALRESFVLYVATRNAFVLLEDMRRISAPAITASARSAW